MNIAPVLVGLVVFLLLGVVLGLFGFIGPGELALIALVSIGAALVYRRRRATA